MRKLYASGALAGLLLIGAPTVALAAPPQEFVTGGGISELGTRFGFTAHNSPTGPSGHATFSAPGAQGVGQRKGEVVCLNVEGNEAVIGIRDEADPADTDENPVYREFYIQDNGEPTGGEPVDELREIGSGAFPDCAFPADRSGLVLESGNITVIDAS